MVKRYRRTASARAKRKNRRHGGIPQLAAQISGRSLSMVYRVLYGEVTSATVQQAIAEAERQLGATQERVA
jgi:hypothetical protein